MAVYKDYAIKLDTMRTPKIALQNIVAGETGNRLTVTLTNGLATVSLNASTHRVCLRIDSALGTRRQDSSVEDSGISFSNGNVIILLSREAYTVGLNRCRLEIFSTESEENDTLICSAEFQFTAAGNATGENAGKVYPSLIESENACREATEAALAAAALIDANGVPLLLTSDSVEWDGDAFSCAIEESYDDVIATHSDGVYRPLMIVVDGYLLCERQYSYSGGNLTIQMSADTGLYDGSITATLHATGRFQTVGVIGYKTHHEEPLYVNLSDGFTYNDLKDAWDAHRQVYLIQSVQGYADFKMMHRLSHLDNDGSTYYAGFIGTGGTWRTNPTVICYNYTANDPDEEMS